jgi:hypothetical protein
MPFTPDYKYTPERAEKERGTNNIIVQEDTKGGMRSAGGIDAKQYNPIEDKFSHV